LAASLTEPFALLIADVNEAPLGPLEAIRAARSAGARVLAFGSHVDERALQAARDAGADLVVPRSAVAGGLAALIDSLLTASRSSRSNG
jgi:DNA-binding NarL/FixJ family response regulator